MVQITDKDGLWEVTEGNGCINKCLIEPSAEYLANNPVVTQEPTIEERVDELENVMLLII